MLALQLLSTAEGSTSDVSGLHAKLDRKHCVEEDNQAAQAAFLKGFTHSIDSMKARVTEASADRTEHISAMQAGMGEPSTHIYTFTSLLTPTMIHLLCTAMNAGVPCSEVLV